MRILIADDHSVVRTGLKQILADAFPAAEFGEAATAQETLALVDQGGWDLLLLDIFMPGRDGLEVLAEVRSRKLPVPVLVLSSAPEEQLALRVLRAGAAGYLTKQTATEDLLRAVNTVLSGARYVSAKLAQRLAANLSHPALAPEEKLSGREYQVLHMLAAGKSLKEVAQELGVSPKTISTFHTRIWQKLGVSNDVALGKYVTEHGLGENPDSPNPPLN
jgi:two-component system, NarL family, invasion response regulator UvrY